MKNRKHIISLLCAVVMIFAMAVPAGAAVVSFKETSVSSSILESVLDYTVGLELAVTTGNTDKLSEIAVSGIVADEIKHRDRMLEAGIGITDVSWEIISVNSCDVEISVVLDEKMDYVQGDCAASETIQHTLTIMYDENNAAKVVSDRYTENVSGFNSCSYVSPSNADTENPDISVLALNYVNLLVTKAKSQVGYKEKASNSSLDSFTENAGSGNYTKYGAWYGLNGEPWCAIFVSWCANQAGISTSIIPKYASCTTGMTTFTQWGRFYSSLAYGGSYTPQVGDIFFTGPNAGTSHHTGIVVAVSNSTITVVDGNYSDQVSQHTYSLSDSSLLGFASPNYCTSSAHNWVYMGSYYKCSICGSIVASIPSVS